MSNQKHIEFDNVDELQNRIDEIADMSADELINHIILGKFTISENVHPDDIAKLDFPTIQRWEIKVLPVTESRPVCILIIVPLDPGAREIWTHGQITIGMRAGLAYENAVLWAKSNHRSKHRWLKLLVRCLSHPKVLVAYEEYYNNRKNRDFDFDRWANDHDIQERMHPTRRVAFVQFMRECAGSVKK